MHQPARLLLKDGTIWNGYSVGLSGTSGGEICFNTGMTGYQEIYTDPSYAGQIIVNTTAHIGNYGALDEETESSRSFIKGIVVNEYAETHSRSTAQESLQQFLEKQKIVGIAGIDTRALVRHIRNKGAMNALISTELSEAEMKQALEQLPDMEGLELSSQVCTQKKYVVATTQKKYVVAALDVGLKKSIVQHLAARGCEVHVFPAKATWEEIQAIKPTGYFVSNGPGDPAAMPYAVEVVKKMINDNKPVFGICLGHQLIALANGLNTYKMHHGHRGLNHPVKNLVSGRGEITSQNHGFAVSQDGLENHPDVEVTHEHLNDHTIMGIRMKQKPVFSVQYHPEASPGPHDSHYLFDQFIEHLQNV